MSEMVRLGDVVNVSASNLHLPDDDIWLLNLDMVEQQTGNIIDYNFVPKEKLNGSIIQFDTENVLYSKLRPNLNKVVIPIMNGYATSEMLPLRPNLDFITKEYLCAYLRSDSFVTWAVSKTSGAKMPRLGTKELLSKTIPFPPLPEQRHIAAVLDKVSELIALRKRQLDLLDEMVKARFVEMFGTICETEYKVLKDVCTLITDGTHNPPIFVDKGIPFLLVSNIRENRITYDTHKFITEETYNQLMKRTPIEKGDVLLSTVGSYGHPAIVNSDKKFSFQRHIAQLKPNHKILNSVFLHSAILSPSVQRQIDSLVLGVAQKTLNLSAIKTIKIPLPRISEQNQFANFVQQVEKSKATVQQGLDRLNLLKSALMQEYFG